MFRFTRWLVVALVAVALLAACSDLTPPARTLTEKDAGTTVQLRTGDKLEVDLNGNPVTGNTWENASQDTSVLKQLGSAEFRRDPTITQTTGHFVLQFRAVAPGQTKLQLIYHNPSQKGVAPAGTFEATVDVK